jgi:hypothetical protein
MHHTLVKAQPCPAECFPSACMHAYLYLEKKQSRCNARSFSFIFLVSLFALHCTALLCFIYWKFSALEKGRAMHCTIYIHASSFWIKQLTQSRVLLLHAVVVIQSNPIPHSWWGGGEKVVATCHPSWTVCLPISILVGRLPIQSHSQAAQLASKSCIS